MPRLFFALWPGDAQRDAFYHAAKAAHRTSGGRIMRRGNLHQTLVFIGNVADDGVNSVKEAAAALVVRAFTLEFGSVRYWRHNRIVWAAPAATPGPLTELVAMLDARLDAAGIVYDKRAYQPHVTLVREGRPPGELPPLEFNWQVCDFALVESARDERGVVYRVNSRWPLAGA